MTYHFTSNQNTVEQSPATPWSWVCVWTRRSLSSREIESVLNLLVEPTESQDILPIRFIHCFVCLPRLLFPLSPIPDIYHLHNLTIPKLFELA